MGAFLNESLRFQVTLESVTTDPDEPTYSLVANTDGDHVLACAGDRVIFSRETPSGLHSVQTGENFDALSGSVEFALGEFAQKLYAILRPNDVLRIEVSSNGKPYRLAFLGLVCNITYSLQSTPQTIKTGLVIQAQGPKKLFTQSIYNWQSVLAMGDDILLTTFAQLAFRKLLAKASAAGFTVAPHELIREFVDIGITNALSAIYQGKPIAPGGSLFSLGTGRGEKDPFWCSLYPRENFPNTAALLMETWEGNLWGVLEKLAQPNIHELFWTYGVDKADGQEKAILVHRPRPFPATKFQSSFVKLPGPPPAPAPSVSTPVSIPAFTAPLLDKQSPVTSTDLDLTAVADQDPETEIDTDRWDALKRHTLGKDGKPGAIGLMRQHSDAGRINAFHWAMEGFNDHDAGGNSAKLQQGWWADTKGIAKYGFSPRGVEMGLIPQSSENFNALLSAFLLRVASMEAPLYAMGNESLVFGTVLPGFHIGEVVEDWSEGFPVTGYISSISHSYRSTPQSIAVSTTIGLSRCLPSTFENYPAVLLTMTDLTHIKYPQDSTHPAIVAKAGTVASS